MSTMDETRDLLVEIGTEELPPTALLPLSTAFADALSAQFGEHALAHHAVEPFATPRRLALIVRRLASRQPDREHVRRGPAVKAAFDASGAPTKAALGFAQSCGIDVDALGREDNDKGSWLVHRSIQPGQSTAALLPDLVGAALSQLPIQKRMRWGDSDVTFVRPVHWICMRFGSEPVAGHVLEVPIGTQTRGHRFHHPESLTIGSPDDYAPALRAAYVEPSFDVRRSTIRDQVTALAASVGGTASIPQELLDEVTALCEWPVALLGHFDEAFLEVPAEALIETMQQHQKYFAVRSSDGALLPSFIAVSNIESREPDVVRAGNERVIRPRFSDARFFWEQDLRIALADRRPALERIVFQHKLGTVADKSRRVAALSRQIAGLLGYDAALAERSASLAKCDLVTAMVGEFAGLQGVMGRYYAARSGEPPCVADALEEQYLPRHAGDRLPTSDCGRVLALADKLDTLVGIFAIGERPTGVKDPYGLRRAAIGVLRILIETPMRLDLRLLLDESATAFPASIPAASAAEETYAYIMERLPGYYADQGIEADAIEAVMAVDASAPSDFDRRVRAVTAFSGLDAAAALAAANKRIANILKKSETRVDGAELSETLLQADAERRLAADVARLQEDIAPLIAAGDYREALKSLAGLRPDVDRFFDEVMVMAEDPRLRANRIALVQGVRKLFTSIADIGRLRIGEQG
jgi:glycyl-tRNA synthetase beta chain